MIDRTDLDRVLTANRYLVLGTADADGRPWVSPVFFAPLGTDAVCWVSGPDSRHSRNIAGRAEIAITVFDSTVAIGGAEAAYFDADAAPVSPNGTAEALAALNAKLPPGKELADDDLQPAGPLVVYRAELRRRYLLVRGGNAEFGNVIDRTIEVP